jgi:DNA mismatch repair ATPase MutS
VRPRLVDGGEARLRIEGGRHPILDVLLDGAAVPNDTALSASGQATRIITGADAQPARCRRDLRADGFRTLATS